MTNAPNQCRSCNSQMKDVRLCLVCYTAHRMNLLSNRGHSKIECTNPWHAEGIAAPLEPTRHGSDAIKFWRESQPFSWDNKFTFAEAYAAAVSKNLQEELQSLRAQHAQAQKELSEIYRCIPLSVLREYIPNWPKSVERIGEKP